MIVSFEVGRHQTQQSEDDLGMHLNFVSFDHGCLHQLNLVKVLQGQPLAYLNILGLNHLFKVRFQIEIRDGNTFLKDRAHVYRISRTVSHDEQDVVVMGTFLNQPGNSGATSKAL